MCLGPRLNWMGLVRRWAGLGLPVKYFTGRSKAVLLLWVLCVFFCLVFVVRLCASIYVCLVVTCLERADLLALVCTVKLWVCYFPVGILGRVWYLIVSIPDLCILTYFDKFRSNKMIHQLFVG